MFKLYAKMFLMWITRKLRTSDKAKHVFEEFLAVWEKHLSEKSKKTKSKWDDMLFSIGIKMLRIVAQKFLFEEALKRESEENKVAAFITQLTNNVDLEYDLNTGKISGKLRI